MPQFKIGDKVRRNNFDDLDSDGNDIQSGQEGIIIEINTEDTYYQRRPYLVEFKKKTSIHTITWWIRGECIELSEPETQESKEQKVIAKIKYLNEKYAKSRTVPTQVVDAEQRELGASVTSIRRETIRIPAGAVGIHNSIYFDGNAIRSETARLRGVDSIYEYRIYLGGPIERITFPGTE